MKNFKLDISKIKDRKETEIPFDENVDLGDVELRGQKIVLGVIHLKGSAISADDGIILSGFADGAIILNCSRCLKKFDHPLRVRMNEYFAIRGDEAERKIEDDSIDVSGIVIEEMALSLDFKTLCKEDCAGLCPKCGIDKNIETCKCEDKSVDIRWHKLKELKGRFQPSDHKSKKDSKD